MTEGYKKYLQLPKATTTTEHRPLAERAEMYYKRWCKITGMSMVSPHPHRHFTFEEFQEKLTTNNEFMERFG